jgi:DNA replication protein DnaC
MEKMLLKGWGILFMGGFGTGKSLLCNHVLKTAIDKGYSAITRQFSEMVHISMTGEDYKGNKCNIYKELSTHDFYCIDDYVYAHIEDNGGKLLIPVVYKLNDSIIKLPCIEYSKWVKEMYKG